MGVAKGANMGLWDRYSMLTIPPEILIRRPNDDDLIFPNCRPEIDIQRKATIHLITITKPGFYQLEANQRLYLFEYTTIAEKRHLLRANLVLVKFPGVPGTRKKDQGCLSLQDV